jgi:DNA-binding CsgD family transcriptional regulator
LRLRQITEFLANESDFRAGLKFVAVNVCSSGEPARLLLNRFDNSSGLSHVFSFGYTESLISLGQTHPFFTHQAQTRSLGAVDVISIQHDEIYDKLFRDSVGFSDETKFEMTFIIPMRPEFVMTISSRAHPLDGGLPEELGLLGAIVNLYLSMVDQDLWNQTKSTKRKSIYPGQPLTERQTLILQLIREGKHNHEIANLLGYSESLIRQETIAIYKKLGVSGRKSLNNTKTKD